MKTFTNILIILFFCSSLQTLAAKDEFAFSNNDKKLFFHYNAKVDFVLLIRSNLGKQKYRHSYKAGTGSITMSQDKGAIWLRGNNVEPGLITSRYGPITMLKTPQPLKAKSRFIIGKYKTQKGVAGLVIMEIIKYQKQPSIGQE